MRYLTKIPHEISAILMGDAEIQHPQAPALALALAGRVEATLPLHLRKEHTTKTLP